MHVYTYTRDVCSTCTAVKNKTYIIKKGYSIIQYELLLHNCSLNSNQLKNLLEEMMAISSTRHSNLGSKKDGDNPITRRRIKYLIHLLFKKFSTCII